MDELCRLLDVEPGGVFRFDMLRLEGWGTNLVFAGRYEQGAAVIAFRLTLHDCRDIQWRVYAHRGADSPPAVLVSIRLGQDNQRKPMQMLTDAFGLTAYYGSLSMTRPD